MQIKTRDGGYITLDIEEIGRAVRAVRYEQRFRLMEATGCTLDDVEYALYLADDDEDRARAILEKS